MPVPALLGAAAISAGGGLIGGFLNRQSSMEAMDYQAELNQRAIDRQNAYNHPLAQRQRYEEAGLNPYLAMTDSGNQSASAQTSLAQPDVGTPISQAAQSIGNAVMQYPQLKADIANKQANTDFINEQQRGVKIENDFKSLRIQGELEQLKAQTDKLVEEGKLTKKQGQLLIDTYEEQKRAYALQNDSTEATIANTKADTTNKEHETKKIDAETDLLKAKKVTETTVQLLNRANAAKSDAEKRQIEAIIPKLGEYYDSMIYANRKDNWETVGGRVLTVILDKLGIGPSTVGDTISGVGVDGKPNEKNVYDKKKFGEELKKVANLKDYKPSDVQKIIDIGWQFFVSATQIDRFHPDHPRTFINK